MNTTTLTRLKWFWAWQDEKEEAWLRQMSREGWHLVQVGFPGLYRFEAGAPQDRVYRLDFNTERKDYQAYLQLFRDAGWKHIGEYGSWQYFSTEARPGEDPELYTDNASKARKYQRVMLLLVVLLPILLMTVTRLSRLSGTFFEVAAFVGFLLMLVYIYAMLNLIRRVSQLLHRP